MDCELVGRVTRATVIGLVPIAVAGAVLAGPAGAWGVAAGALISLASFRWIARASGRAGALMASGRPGTLWVLALGCRHLALFGAVALVLWSGTAHPLGLVGGLSLLPPILIVSGLRAVRAAG